MLNASPIKATDYSQAVGTIYCDGAIRGIATHIDTLKDSQDQSVIVTAAHVLYNPQTDQLFSQCHYRPQNKRLSGIAFETISAHNYSVKNKDKIAQAESDLVFIRLKNRAHQPKLKLAQDFYNVESKFSLISSDLDGFKLTRCNKIDHHHLNSERLVLHNCPVQQGSSGSPILDSESGDVIAVHGGRFTVQTAENGEENTQWIGQARRIDLIMLNIFHRLTTQKPH
jgi:V8-like Glu-specific endopeptidase